MALKIMKVAYSETKDHPYVMLNEGRCIVNSMKSLSTKKKSKIKVQHDEEDSPQDTQQEP